jgi:hypothetical protein
MLILVLRQGCRGLGLKWRHREVGRPHYKRRQGRGTGCHGWFMCLRAGLLA